MVHGLLGRVAALTALAFTLAIAPAQATTIERVVSPKGIEAWVVRNSTVPLLAIQFAFVGGTSQDAADKLGTANMVAGLLDEGAGELTSAAFQERLEREAIELRFSADRDQLRGSLRTLTERRESALDLLRLSLMAPRFDADAVERIRNQVSVQLRRESADPSSLAAKAWWAAAFPQHPYGREQKGTQETLAAITTDDLKAYAKRVIARDRLKVAIVGDIDLQAVGPLLDQVFGALPTTAELTPVADAKPGNLGRREVVTFDTPQAVVTLGGNGVPRKHPDFMAAYVVNHVLGGGSFTSRLYQEVREKRGLAYGVNTYMYPLQHAALFMGWTQVRADRAGDSLKIIEDEIRRMAEAGPTEEELGKAKEYLKGSYALNFDTSTKIAQQLVQIQIEDLGIDYINTRNAQIDAVTLADAKRVAKSFLEGGLLTTVVGRPVGVTPTGGPG
ncbi:MAG: insulinase family protein [Variibacter sp.]|nr:insulinase family protein [Variibacter sp.]